MALVQQRLAQITQTQADSLARAAEIVCRVIAADGLVFLFGTGHSHLLAEEGHYRAGGLACVCPILYSAVMLHEGAIMSGHVERTSDLAVRILARYRPQQRDAILIFSNSGVNTMPVEMAQAARAAGMPVIAIVALAYAAQAPLGSAGVRLADAADVVIDNGGVPGDALVAVMDSGLRAGPLSTIAGAYILNTVLVEAAARAHALGVSVPVYISANMPGAQAHNDALTARYRPRNPHL
jgi:uncharacterized phosphosugar-binding protein